jgi:hypothetical protein
MSTNLVELYCSSNGDTWFLEKNSGRDSFVIHEPNRPSGGHRSRIPVEEFLKRNHGPERQALLRMLDEINKSELDESSLVAVMRDCPL